MIKHCLVTGSLILMVSASIASGGSNVDIPIMSKLPTDIEFPASVGAVTFPHQMHLADLGVKCVECHHQINARKLNTPHPDYLKSSWINCKTCHKESGKAQQIYACSECHRANPKDIANETLSAKVVIHKSCGNCHPLATGKEASMSCEKCHTGKKVSNHK